MVCAPEGSILGTSLFILCINTELVDLPGQLNNFLMIVVSTCVQNKNLVQDKSAIENKPSCSNDNSCNISKLTTNSDKTQDLYFDNCVLLLQIYC